MDLQIFVRIEWLPFETKVYYCEEATLELFYL